MQRDQPRRDTVMLEQVARYTCVFRSNGTDAAQNSTARALMSARFPIGVATTYNACAARFEES
jgi:hypothetical protein